ncbi:hypothetical protein TSAR_003598 [Trichomalopsis sarcophagae]|uniref:Uncharacterized protein n=1 Tax=Trichomalopsis sarcophagae TaxID=543379 RepID=A0A232EVW9_9HYME|nr:hypothetical protein TSAR_003598 [Trichomalopsis sarcophagae]
MYCGLKFTETLRCVDWGTFDHYIKECEKTIEWTENLPGEKYERFNLLFKEEGNIKIVNAI